MVSIFVLGHSLPTFSSGKLDLAFSIPIDKIDVGICDGMINGQVMY